MGEPLLKFDPIRLNEGELRAWANVVAAHGHRRVVALFDQIVECVRMLADEGKTPAEINEVIVGYFYDNMSLMKRGQAIRDRTILLARAMVEQAIDAVQSL